jgi:GNAT superfamily N-acetyltransferase
MSVSQVSIRGAVVMRPLCCPAATVAPVSAPSSATVRPAAPDDVPDIVRLVRDLAEYERALDQMSMTPQQLTGALFPDHAPPALFAHVAEVDGHVVGTALWFLSFSTWTGTHGIWLEDLYVDPPYRGRGLGQDLLRTLAQVCVDRGYDRFEWWVLDWNAPSIGFYESIGAAPQAEWVRYRLAGSRLAAHAAT